MRKAINNDPVSELAAWRAETQVDTAVWIGELIDNALDANAKRIKIVLDGQTLSIRDNGDGCAALVNLMEVRRVHALTDHNSIGRYGGGAKKACAVLCSRMSAQSRVDGRLYRASVDYDEILDSGNATYEEEPPTPNSGASFMEIKLEGLRQKWTLNTIKRIRQDCARRYFPALSNGVRIIINDESVQPLALPLLDEAINVEGKYNGLSYVGHIGIVKHGQDQLITDWRRCGWHIACQQRFLNDAGDRRGFGEHINARVFGTLELREDKGRWPLDLHKRAMVGQEEFLETLYPRIEGILRKASEDQKSLALLQQSQILEETLEALLGGPVPARPKRKARTPKDDNVIQLPTKKPRRPVQNPSAATPDNNEDSSARIGGRRVKWDFSNEMEPGKLIDISWSSKAISILFNYKCRYFHTKKGMDILGLTLMAIDEIAQHCKYEVADGEKRMLSKILPIQNESLLDLRGSARAQYVKYRLLELLAEQLEANPELKRA